MWPGVLESRIFSVDRTSEIFLKHFKKETHRLIQLEAIAVLLFQAGLLFFLAVPALKYFLLYYGFGLSWSSLQYIHHYQAERDVIDGARNLSFWKPIDLIWLNHNLHQTHHQVPTASWIHLNRLASEKETKASPLIPAYFRLWRGPQAAESGHSKVFDGEVSR